ncbi:MAG TPA: tRNA 2-thiouridine(34) synthase MnmA [Chitinophagales bacterium]|jgi:tRNA-specific 2-thiouridylase|nr:tRNA 2-thiouridine(34) synthase MnmA [Chitinophagales bacterium]MBP6155283.1 tRNA 2-thiouridine(34) synthase MnmA [Chitinophagales bacterium]HQV78100.1 tRNA 2-thiouridine(34) synthase MnmA [Chitinophagales bacterium]HQW80107.1 tRNA 2-thiouridine(34) synthase MnmA [Chitinophagales bacterium]HRB19473.1 tRNA 2-thiouridine(34) synthase MnmA [Chitinophagales bacterium]
MKKRVVVGMSGGVDSSVAAYLMQQQGYEVIGLFMKNWHDGSVTIQGDCPWIDDSNDALLVAQKLGIPFQTLDLSNEYKERIVDYMFAEYKAGRTPNPDILCNREIKFDIFLKHALNLGADFVATGHYCRKSSFEKDGKTIYQLLAGKDNNKDQSYFLCQLNQAQLSKAFFPIGELTKPQVREIAKKLNLITADKKDSQGLCFIGKVRLPDFLQQQLKSKEGNVVLIPKTTSTKQQLYDFENCTPKELELFSQAEPYCESDGKIIGTHQGAHFYTIGQRKGIKIGGFKEALFVIKINTKENLIFLGEGEEHAGLNRAGLFIKNENIHFIREDLNMNIGEKRRYKARIRYRQPLEECCLYQQINGLYIIFKNLQKGIAPGQFCTWYLDDELIGSGEIA